MENSVDKKVELAVRQKLFAAKNAAAKLAVMPTAVKNAALQAMAAELRRRSEIILAANARDISNAEKNGVKSSFIDRLALNENRLRNMADSLRETAALPDPIGECDFGVVRPNGLEIRRIRVPLGVVAIIYEARPNVTSEAASLTIKSGNAVLLRGGKEALETNIAVVEALRWAAESEGVPPDAISFIDFADRSSVDVMLNATDLIDVIIPRGGASLIKKITAESKVPVIETGAGICHTFVDETADLAMAERIIINAKTSRPSVCNALETLLIHSSIAAEFLPRIAAALKERGVELRGCLSCQKILPDMIFATEEDWATEYDDLILSIKIVHSLDEAIAHINRYNTGHSETIVTHDVVNARRFQKEVNAAAVYVNASTRFTDGFEFGFGAEIGISTQKLHARGPMGLRELTTTKYLIDGDGQIR